MRILAALLMIAATPALAESWTPSTCGDQPTPPHYDLTTRAGYNDAVKKANTYQHAARAYADCVLKQAHDDETAVSRGAQNKIASIQADAVSLQQALYARLTAQSATFKAAADKLKGQ